MEDEMTDREMEVALYGDGRRTTYWGQDGDPRNGERLYNTKEDDAANDAEAERLRAANRCPTCGGKGWVEATRVVCWDCH